MTRWWPLAVLIAVLAMLVSPRTASASSAMQLEIHVGGFDLVALPLVGRLATPSAEKHPGNSVAYDETAPDYSLASESAAQGALNTLKEAGKAIDREGYTYAGRALQKHGDRGGSVFPQIKGSVVAVNKQGQAVLEAILGSVTRTESNRFGGMDYYGGPTGGGVRFNAQGQMMGFLEP